MAELGEREPIELPNGELVGNGQGALPGGNGQGAAQPIPPAPSTSVEPSDEAPPEP
jgi:hypothetical protein